MPMTSSSSPSSFKDIATQFGTSITEVAVAVTC